MAQDHQRIMRNFRAGLVVLAIVGLDVGLRSRAAAAPVALDWTNFLPSYPHPMVAAVYTPYHITYGGGERYLLQAVGALQMMGYAVDVLVTPGNVCDTKEKLLEVAAGLRVDLRAEALDIHLVTTTGPTLNTQKKYSVFFLLGNDKFATYRGIGTINFYMCQFPFDLDEAVDPSYIEVFSSYTYVLLNSEFTYRWYSKYAEPLFQATRDAGMLVPQVELLYPPVHPFAPAPSGSASERKHIVLLGRFFSGRQSKGHDTAIKIFSKIRNRLPPGVKLRLIGKLMPAHERYLEHLHHLAANLPVEFAIGKSSSEVQRLLHQSKVQWHLTGAKLKGTNDPASFEHFGIAIVEGMSAGCIPIAVAKGGVSDIIEHGKNGFLAAGALEVAKFTVGIYEMGLEHYIGLKHAAEKRVKAFATPKFTKNFAVLVTRGFLTRSYRHVIQQTESATPMRGAQYSAALRSRNVAVLVEPRQHYALEFVVKNALEHLPSDWALHVFHGQTNGNYTKHVLSGVSNVRFSELPFSYMRIQQYNGLLKNKNWWLSLDADNVLIFQTDSLLVNRNIQDFIGYDYVGAPWHMENERWSKMMDVIPGGVGNGGLSLRTARSAVAIIEQFGHSTTDFEHEDIFFAKHMGKAGFKLAPRDVAYKFCLEVPCKELHMPDRGPFALHAAWYYVHELQPLQHLYMIAMSS